MIACPLDAAHGFVTLRPANGAGLRYGCSGGDCSDAMIRDALGLKVPPMPDPNGHRPSNGSRPIVDYERPGETVEQTRARLVAVVDAATGRTPPEDDAPPHTDDDAPDGEREPGSDDDQGAAKATIKLGPDEGRVVREAVEALARDPDIYQRSGTLVRVVTDAPTGKKPIEREPGAPRIEAIPAPWIRIKLSTVAQFTRYDARTRKDVPACAPSWAIAAIASQGQWHGIQRLVGFTETPVLRPDGSLLVERGFDEETGLLYEPIGPVDAVSIRPTQADAQRSIKVLLDAVVDFPFAEDVHRAAWLASVLTPLARHAFDGPAPLFLYEANARGSGKGLLAAVTGYIVSGRRLPVSSMPSEDDEARKRITSIALAGESLILFDNVAGTLGSPSLDAALTATTWKDRLLGESKMTGTLPLFLTWFATGNNVTLGADTARRVIPIRLVSPLENPEERTGFHHPRLLAHVRAERPRLVAAALTILRAWHVAGRPDMGITPLGSFEGWTMVRSAVRWLGMEDPLAAQRLARDHADRDAGELRGLVDGLAEAAPAREWVTASEIIRRVEAGRAPGLKEVLLEYLPGEGGKVPTAQRLGKRLRHYLDRVIGDRSIQVRPTSQVAQWRVAEASRPTREESEEFKGSVPPRARDLSVRNDKYGGGSGQEPSDFSDSSNEGTL